MLPEEDDVDDGKSEIDCQPACSCSGVGHGEMRAGQARRSTERGMPESFVKGVKWRRVGRCGSGGAVTSSDPLTPCCRWTLVQSSSSVESGVCVDHGLSLATRYVVCMVLLPSSHTALYMAPKRHQDDVVLQTAVVCSEALARCRTFTRLYMHDTAWCTCILYMHTRSVYPRTTHHRARCLAARPPQGCGRPARAGTMLCCTPCLTPPTPPTPPAAVTSLTGPRRAGGSAGGLAVLAACARVLSRLIGVGAAAGARLMGMSCIAAAAFIVSTRHHQI